ncbi:MAG: hypothetical protein K0S65_3015, partial [Labilithrix sp.]|nr:hypothetical protein [Labilithrix sp.]
MKRWNRVLPIAAAALFVGRLASGCAEDGSGGVFSPSDDGGVDAPTTIPSVQDAGADVSDDASADAEAPTCSADGWCYTALPTRESIDAGPPPEWGPDTVLQMNSVWVAPDHSTWAVTQGGHVLRWDGATWTVVTNVGKPLYSIWGLSATDLWIGGANALVLHGTFDAGQLTLEAVATDLRTATLNLRQGARKIWGTSATDIWILGEFGGVFHLEPSPDGGPPAFVEMDLPTDCPGPDYIGPFSAGALWGTANEVWVAGVDDRYYCYP